MARQKEIRLYDKVGNKVMIALEDVAKMEVVSGSDVNPHTYKVFSPKHPKGVIIEQFFAQLTGKTSKKDPELRNWVKEKLKT